MLDRATIEGVVQSFFGRRSAGVVAVYLFGSVARDEARPTSDVDLAVLLGEDPPRTLDGLGLDLADGLQAELGAPVQVVVLNTAPCDLTHRVPGTNTSTSSLFWTVTDEADRKRRHAGD